MPRARTHLGEEVSFDPLTNDHAEQDREPNVRADEYTNVEDVHRVLLSDDVLEHCVCLIIIDLMLILLCTVYCVVIHSV